MRGGNTWVCMDSTRSVVNMLEYYISLFSGGNKYSTDFRGLQQHTFISHCGSPSHLRLCWARPSLVCLNQLHVLLVLGPKLWWSSHCLGHVLFFIEAPESEQKHTIPLEASAENWHAVTSSRLLFFGEGPMSQSKVNMAEMYAPCLLGKHSRNREIKNVNA